MLGRGGPGLTNSHHGEVRAVRRKNAGVVYQVLGYFAAHQGEKVRPPEAFSGYYEGS